MAGCKVIGIYGGAGSGKSEAVRILHEKYGAYVIKADEVAHRLYRKGQPGYRAVVRICGKCILDRERQIDRKKLAPMLFNDDSLLAAVNRAVHPMVYARTKSMIGAYRGCHTHSLIIFEAALLPERKLDFIDENWYVHTDESVRSTRMKMTRNYSDDRIKSVIDSQPSEAVYREYCSRVIENNGTLKELEDSIDEAIKHCQRQQR